MEFFKLSLTLSVIQVPKKRRNLLPMSMLRLSHVMFAPRLIMIALNTKKKYKIKINGNDIGFFFLRKKKNDVKVARSLMILFFCGIQHTVPSLS